MPESCYLEALVGRRAACPGAACAFWHEGDGCVLEGARPELGGRRDVAALLISVRDRLSADLDALDSARLAALAHALNDAPPEE
jgi:hypothetical protein